MSEPSSTRPPQASDPKDLVAGDPHYRAYVGPPNHYDFMGATQFRLLTTLGLRAHHKLLDFGCGSLRAGRLLIPYLEPGHYCGVEPNKWLVEEAIAEQVGADQVRIKQPRFDHNEEFKVDAFGDQFDWIVAQSIFSHTGKDLLGVALHNFQKQLTENGRVVATFIGGDADYEDGGWVYPDCVQFRDASVIEMARAAGLAAVRLPWFHPRQTWWVLARREQLLPPREVFPFLRGAVVFDDELSVSWRRWLQNRRPLAKRVLERLLGR